MTQNPITAEPITAKYQGVGGWLLVLCVVMTIISPLRSVYNLTSGFAEVLPLRGEFPGLMVVAVIDTILSVALVAFGFYAGLKLWRILPGAVKAAKIYFLVFLAYSVVAAFLPFMAGLPKESNKILAAEMPKTILGGVIYFCVWFAYLSVSKRVKATYPDEQETVDAMAPSYPAQPNGEDNP